MDKSYKKVRANLRRPKMAQPQIKGTGFILRMLLCFGLFLYFAFARLCGGDMLAQTKNGLEYYLRGAPDFVRARDESIEAFNQFCDRIVEAQK